MWWSWAADVAGGCGLGVHGGVAAGCADFGNEIAHDACGEAAAAGVPHAEDVVAENDEA